MSPRQNYFFDRIKVLLNNNSNNLCSYSKKKHKIISFFVFVQTKQTTLIYNEIIIMMRQKHIKLKEKINIILLYILCLNPHPTLSFYVYDYFWLYEFDFSWSGLYPLTQSFIIEFLLTFTYNIAGSIYICINKFSFQRFI